MIVGKLHSAALPCTACKELLVVLISNSRERVMQATGIALLVKVVNQPYAGWR